VVPLSALNFAQLSLQSIVPALVLPDLIRDKGPIARIEFGHQLRDEMGVLGCFLNGWEGRTGCLALSNILDFSILHFPIVHLALDFLL
jgi:hypothetical protein